MDVGIKGDADRKVDGKCEGVGVGSSVGLRHENGSGVGVGEKIILELKGLPQGWVQPWWRRSSMWDCIIGFSCMP